MKYVFLMVLFCCSAICFGNEPPQTSLTVEAINNTAEGSSVAGDEATVNIYHENKLLQTFSGKLTDDGSIVFSTVPAGDHFVAVASVKHQDMMFSSQPVMLGDNEADIHAHIQVFDVSHDTSKLSIKTHHFLIKVQERQLHITEYMQLNNSSDMAIISQDKVQDRDYALKVMLPEGFENLQCLTYFERHALIVTEQGFYDTMAVPSGEFHLAFSYTLDIKSKNIDISKKFSLPTASFMIFSDIGSAQLQGLEASASQATGTEGSAVNYYTINDISPDDTISFKLTNFNVRDFRRSEWMIFIVIFACVLILALTRLFLNKKNAESN